MTKVEKCSCPESQHLRRALLEIKRIATSETEGSVLEDLAQCGNLADQGLRLRRLVGDPSLDTKVRTG